MKPTRLRQLLNQDKPTLGINVVIPRVRIMGFLVRSATINAGNRG